MVDDQVSPVLLWAKMARTSWGLHTLVLLKGWGCSSAGRASARHAAAAKEFSLRDKFQCRLLRCAIACICICAHVKDPVVHVRVRWIMETLKHPACTVGWVARLCRSWLSPLEGNPNFPWEKSHWDNTVLKVQSKVKRLWPFIKKKKLKKIKK